jgi:cytochrome d ubiquinol oxidase subunit I
VLYQKKWLMKFYVFSVVLPVIANQAGWFSAERGRQPWIVQGLLRTSEGFSPNLKSYEIIISLVLFALTYVLLLFSWIYILNKEIQHGPEHIHTIPSHDTEKKFLDAAIDLKKEKHGF